MSRAPPDLGTLRLDDSVDDGGLWDSPDPAKSSRKPNGSTQQHESRHSSEEVREAALRKELETVRGVNNVIEGVIESLEKAKGNMDTVHRTVNSASTLLNTWTRILSQTEHNQRLLLNPQWQGATQDMEDAENEVVQRQQAAERRAAEEQRMREEAARRKEEEEMRRAVAPSTTRPARGTRGRVRGTGLGRGASSTAAPAGYVGVGGQGGRGRVTSTTRAGSGIGRGVGAAARGRGRGTT